MGSDDHHLPQKQLRIPTIDLSRISAPESERRSDEWEVLCRKVREACEEFGCFEVVYEQIPVELRAETFMLVRQVLELPMETKELNVNPKPYHGYSGVRNLYESLGIEDATNVDSLRAFAQLMWPHDHDDHGHAQNFCKTVGSMTKHLGELWRMVEMLILDGYGLLRTPSAGIVESKTLLRINKYKPPPSRTEGYMNALPTHTDKLLCTFLCDDEVSALQIRTKQPTAVGGDFEFISVPINPTSLIFVVGETLMAWSNGRMHSVIHRVEMSGKKERYSLAAFQVPVAGTVIRAPEELVDDASNHPKLFNDFDFTDFIDFSLTKEGSTDLPTDRVIHAYAAYN